MAYPMSYSEPPARYRSRGRQKFHRSWVFDTNDLSSGKIALNVEATYLPR